MAYNISSNHSFFIIFTYQSMANELVQHIGKYSEVNIVEEFNEQTLKFLPIRLTTQ